MKLPNIVNKIGVRVAAVRKSLIDPYPESAVAMDPTQFWQRGLDRNTHSNMSVTAAESGVDRYAHSISLMTARHRKRVGQALETIETSELAKLLHNPNSYQTSSDFTNFMVRRLLVNGASYAVAERNERFEIIALHPVMAPSCEPYIDPETKAVFYSVGNNPLAPYSEANYMIPQRDVLHIKLYTPHHPLKGISPLSYCAASMAANRSLSAHMATFFDNMARPSFILTTEAKLSREQMNQLRDAWDEQSARLNSGGVPILSSGMSAQQLGISTQDAQLIEAFNMTVEDIARALSIPAPLLGIEAAYNNTEQLINFWLSTGLGFIVNHIEKAFAKFFDLPIGEEVEFDTDTLLRSDYLGRVDGAAKGIIGGLFSPDEARAKFNLPAVPDGFGSEPRVQQQVVPLSQVGIMPEAAPAPEAPPSSANDPDPEIARALVVDLIQRKKA